MGITDELREYAHDCCARVDDAITAIADRIDAEHERLMQEQPFTIDMVPMTDESMAYHGWIRLPKDADGEYIRIGDVMRLGSVERDLTVLGFGVPEVGDNEYGVFVYDCDEYTWYNARFLRHYHKPTVEDVLEELLREYDRDDSELTNGEIIEMFAKRLTLAEGEDA